MKTQIKQGRFETLNIPFHIYPNSRGVLTLFQVNKPQNIYISGLLPFPNNSNTYRGDLYFKDKSITAIRFTLTFEDRSSGEIDVTGLIQAIREYSQYSDIKKAYLQGAVVPQIQATSEQLTDSTQKSQRTLKTTSETTAEAFEDDIEVPQKVLQALNEFQELNPDEKELFTYFQYNLQEIRNYQGKTTSLDMSKSNDNKKVDI